MRVDRVDLLQQVDLVLGQTHVGAVKALRLEGLRQADVHQYALGVLGEGDGLGFQLGVGLVLTLKALGIADVLEEVAGKQRHGAFHALGVDHAAARALCQIFCGGTRPQSRDFLMSYPLPSVQLLPYLL